MGTCGGPECSPRFPKACSAELLSPALVTETQGLGLGACLLLLFHPDSEVGARQELSKHHISE